MENGYWWANGGDPDCVRPGKSFDFWTYFTPLVEQFKKFYNAEEIHQ